jgi:hypothetical protein
MRVAVYARVSMDDKGQDPENQLRELRLGAAIPAMLFSESTLSMKADGRVPIDGSNSLRCSTTRQKGNSIVCCSGR